MTLAKIIKVSAGAEHKKIKPLRSVSASDISRNSKLTKIFFGHAGVRETKFSRSGQ